MDTLHDDEDTLYGKDYATANAKVSEWAESEHGVPKATVDEIDAFFEEVSSMPVTEADLLHVGHPCVNLVSVSLPLVAHSIPVSAANLLHV